MWTIILSDIIKTLAYLTKRNEDRWNVLKDFDEDNSVIYKMLIFVLCLCMCLHGVTSVCLFYQFLSAKTTLSRWSKNMIVLEWIYSHACEWEKKMHTYRRYDKEGIDYFIEGP